MSFFLRHRSDVNESFEIEKVRLPKVKEASFCRTGNEEFYLGYREDYIKIGIFRGLSGVQILIPEDVFLKMVRYECKFSKDSYPKKFCRDIYNKFVDLWIKFKLRKYIKK